MGWIVFAVLAALVVVALWRFGRLPKGGLELVGAAMFIAVAGYAWQGSPGLSGKPTPPADMAKMPDSDFAQEREKLLSRFGADADVLGTADAFHRQGLNLYAIGIIKGALEKRPNSAELWVGLGNAFFIHGGNQMSPAAQLAFQRAQAIAPEHPGPRFFLGLSYAQAGQLDQAETVWRQLLDSAPPGAPWRNDIEERLVELERFKAGMVAR